MSNTASTVRANVLTAVRTAAVATAAGVAAGTWADTTTPRAFDGDRLAAGGRNRGRLPFLEIFLASQPFVPEGDAIGMVETLIRLRAHAGGADPTVAHALCEAILTASFAAIRADSYFNLGESSIEAYASNPCWHSVDARLTVQHTYNPVTFEQT